MNVTKHARIRQQQRCIPNAVLEALERFGAEYRAVGGATLLRFTKKSWKSVKREFGPATKGLERWRNCYAVIGQDGSFVTTGWLR